MTWPDLLAHDEVVELAEAGAGPAAAVGVMAFHAGVEAGTFEIASAAAEASGAALYAVVQPAGLRWHVPSRDVDPASSAQLATWLGLVRRVITVHGYGRKGRPADILVGGCDASLASAAGEILARHLPLLRVVRERDEIPMGLRGVHPANPVNRTAGGGIQLELPVRARLGPLREGVAAAVAELVGVWAAELAR